MRCGTSGHRVRRRIRCRRTCPGCAGWLAAMCWPVGVAAVPSEVPEIVHGQVVSHDPLVRIADDLGIPRGWMGLATTGAASSSPRLARRILCTGAGPASASYCLETEPTATDRRSAENGRSHRFRLLRVPARHTPHTAQAVQAVARRGDSAAGAAAWCHRSLRRTGTPDHAGRIAADATHPLPSRNHQKHPWRSAAPDRGRHGEHPPRTRYDVSVVLYPLSGRRDATALHLEAGRPCRRRPAGCRVGPDWTNGTSGDAQHRRRCDGAGHHGQ